MPTCQKLLVIAFVPIRHLVVSAPGLKNTRSMTKEKMCMTSGQESQYQKNQIEIANMSNKHQVIRIEGDHMVFFTEEKSKIVVEAVSSILSGGPR